MATTGTIHQFMMARERTRMIKNSCFPNFVVIGAGKSGTTSIYHYLTQHPGIFMPKVKEINFFAYGDKPEDRKITGGHVIRQFHARTLDEYAALFAGSRDFMARGEVSPIYLSSHIAAQNIKNLLPDTRIIALLRNPVDRAISSYHMHVSLGLEKRCISEVFAFPEREFYVLAGCYSELLDRYYELFDRDKIRIFLFDEVKADLPGVMSELFRFVGVDQGFQPNMQEVYKKGGLPRSRTGGFLIDSMHRLSRNRVGKWARAVLPRNLLKKTRQSLQDRVLYYPEVSDDIIDKLGNYYRDEVNRTGQLIERDLSHWINTSARPDG